MERHILWGEHILIDRHIISSLTMEQGLPIHITPNPHSNSEVDSTKFGVKQTSG